MHALHGQLAAVVGWSRRESCLQRSGRRQAPGIAGATAGKVTANVLPCPSWLCTLMLPPIFSTRCNVM